MSSEQCWMVNDALGFLMKLSRLFCLAPVRFVQIDSNTFISTSRPLLLLSSCISFIFQLCGIYLLYLAICSSKQDSKQLFSGVLNAGVLLVFVIYAVLNSETRIKNYMTVLTKLRRAISCLQRTEEVNIKKWQVLVFFTALIGGISLVPICNALIYNGSIDYMTMHYTLSYIMTVVVQQQFLYVTLYVSFVLKILEKQLQEELFKIINEEDDKEFDIFSSLQKSKPYKIPLHSINKAIDLIGMIDKLHPDVLTIRKQFIAQRLHQINDGYILVSEVLGDLSSSDGFLLFVQFIYFSISVVYSSSYIIKILNQDESLLSAKLMSHCLALLVLLLRVTMIVEPCHMAHERILKIRFKVCMIMCHVVSANDPVFRIMGGFVHQLVSNDICYTSLGICKIGRPLIVSILGVATTVLIAIH